MRWVAGAVDGDEGEAKESSVKFSLELPLSSTQRSAVSLQ